MSKLKKFVESRAFNNSILLIIILNAVLMGLETSEEIVASPFGRAMEIIDYICIGIFVVEIILKIIAYNKDFFKDGWNIFDLIIVLISLVPNLQMFSAFRVFRVLRVFRSLRALRTFRMVSGFKRLRIIVSSIFESLPGVFWTGLLLLIDFYIFAILGTTLFGERFPDWFGSIGKSMYTLFQVMTLESWSMGISRPVMEVFDFAWLYFVPFVVISAFIVMNVVVGIVVNTISETSAKIAAEDEKIMAELRKKKNNENIENVDETEVPVTETDKTEELKKKLDSLKAQIADIEKML